MNLETMKIWLRMNVTNAFTVEQRHFLKMVYQRAKRAYPSFEFTLDADFDFCFYVCREAEAAPLKMRLAKPYADYTGATSAVRQKEIIGDFVNAIGNTVLMSEAPLRAEDLLIDLRPLAQVQRMRSNPVYLPFIADLAALLIMQTDKGTSPVTHANLETLGMEAERAIAEALKNAASRKHEREFDQRPDWPGLCFAHAETCLPSSLIYLDFVLGGTLPNGAYYVHKQGAYTFAAAQDAASMATLEAFRKQCLSDQNGAWSASILSKRDGHWYYTDTQNQRDAA